jgi:tRNA (5-methylaminomethyl-2-thiouridylate)-methyltransferase
LGPYQTCTDREFSRVQNICKHLGLPNSPLFLSFEKEYWTDVFAPMIESYRLGLTPNPDVVCNRAVKFGAVISRLNELSGGFPWRLATGHYARVAQLRDGGELHLLRSSDVRKDQTYFLSTLDPAVLSRCLFPLGIHRLTKSEVKDRALMLAAPGWRKGEHTPESFGLCFVGQKGGRNSGFRRFLAEFLPPEPGEIVVGPWKGLWPPSKRKESKLRLPDKGKIVGSHTGLWHATIGEKAHLQLDQGNREFYGRWYVARKDLGKNQIVVVKGENNRLLYSSSMIVGNWRWLNTDAEAAALNVQHKQNEHDFESPAIWETGLRTQFRHAQKPVKVVSVTALCGNDKETKTKTVEIVFEEPQRAVSEGQSAALWLGVRCLGGGVIKDVKGVEDF